MALLRCQQTFPLVSCLLLGPVQSSCGLRCWMLSCPVLLMLWSFWLQATTWLQQQSPRLEQTLESSFWLFASYGMRYYILCAIRYVGGYVCRLCLAFGENIVLNIYCLFIGGGGGFSYKAQCRNGSAGLLATGVPSCGCIWRYVLKRCDLWRVLCVPVICIWCLICLINIDHVL